jgi:pimeloyl-ACP methyl ester carboxylesterase
MIRLVGWVLSGLLLVVGASLATMRLGWWNPSYDSVRKAQAGPPSKFVNVGDVRLHVRDEGAGPVLLMLHSSMTNLREWDAWADRLKSRYRVIRIDWPPYGLSIDPNPSRGMGGVIETLERFVAVEQLGRFSLIASSSGATIAVLALSTLPLAAPPPTVLSPALMALLWLHDHVIPNYNPRLYYSLSLSQLYGDPRRLTPETVDWYAATNNLPGGFARVRTYYLANTHAVWSRGAATEAGMIRAPILLQWGDADPVLPRALADQARAEFANAPVTLIHYAGVGHYPMLEIPQQSAADLEQFLDRVLLPP